MGLLTAEGISKEGIVELDEQPHGAGGTARVIVTFLPAQEAKEQAQILNEFYSVATRPPSRPRSRTRRRPRPSRN